jgi:hypothetical protein
MPARSDQLGTEAGPARSIQGFQGSWDIHGMEPEHWYISHAVPQVTDQFPSQAWRSVKPSALGTRPHRGKAAKTEQPTQ